MIIYLEYIENSPNNVDEFNYIVYFAFIIQTQFIFNY